MSITSRSAAYAAAMIAALSAGMQGDAEVIPRGNNRLLDIDAPGLPFQPRNRRRRHGDQVRYAGLVNPAGTKLAKRFAKGRGAAPRGY